MGPPKGKSLEIDTVTPNRLNAIKIMKFDVKNRFRGSRRHPWRVTHLYKVLGLGEPYPMSPHDLKLFFWFKSYSTFST